MKLNKARKCKLNTREIFSCANTRLGWYRRSVLDVVNFILSPTVLGIRKEIDQFRSIPLTTILRVCESI